MRSVKLLILLCLMAAGLIAYTDRQAAKDASEPNHLLHPSRWLLSIPRLAMRCWISRRVSA